MPIVRKAGTVLALTGLLLVIPTARASAEWHFAPLVGYTFKGSTTLVDLEDATAERHWNFGGAVALLGEGPIGVEGYFVYTPGFFQREGGGFVGGGDVISSYTYTLMGNAVLTTPRRWNEYGLRPYVSGGLGLLRVSAKDQFNVTPIRLNLLGMNVGGGAVGFLSDRVGLRFDLRYFRKIQGPDVETLEIPVSRGEPIRLRYWTTAIGVVIKY
jgi:opacity protein-like surface antigen